MAPEQMSDHRIFLLWNTENTAFEYNTFDLFIPVTGAIILSSLGYMM